MQRKVDPPNAESEISFCVMLMQLPPAVSSLKAWFRADVNKAIVAGPIQLDYEQQFGAILLHPEHVKVLQDCVERADNMETLELHLSVEISDLQQNLKYEALPPSDGDDDVVETRAVSPDDVTELELTDCDLQSLAEPSPPSDGDDVVFVETRAVSTGAPCCGPQGTPLTEDSSDEDEEKMRIYTTLQKPEWSSQLEIAIPGPSSRDNSWAYVSFILQALSASPIFRWLLCYHFKCHDAARECVICDWHRVYQAKADEVVPFSRFYKKCRFGCNASSSGLLDWHRHLYKLLERYDRHTKGLLLKFTEHPRDLGVCTSLQSNAFLLPVIWGYVRARTSAAKVNSIRRCLCEQDVSEPDKLRYDLVSVVMTRHVAMKRGHGLEQQSLPWALYQRKSAYWFNASWDDVIDAWSNEREALLLYGRQKCILGEQAAAASGFKRFSHSRH